MALTTVDSGLLSSGAQYTGFKNRIINGAMMIDQRNAGASITNTGTSVYTVDRWFGYGSVTSKFSTQQNAGSVTPPAGFTNYLGVTSLSAYSVSSTDEFDIIQRIEGLNTADLGWGTANAQTVTLSFWVRSSLTGTFGGSFNNSGNSRSYPFSYTISAANTWEQKRITVAGDTSGTWLTTNGIGLQLVLSLGAGSTKSGTAGAWAAGSYVSATGATSVVGTNGATFYITGVQLEKGSTATSFDYRPYGAELALCQRYCIKYDASLNQYMRYGIGECWSTTSADVFVYLPVEMRAKPSLTTTGTAANYAVYSAATITACSSVPSITDATSTKLICLAGPVSSGLTQGRAAQLISNANLSTYLLFTAEL